MFHDSTDQNSSSKKYNYDEFQNEVTKVMTRAWNVPGFLSNGKLENKYFPPCDVEEREDRYLMEVEIPGVVLNSINLEVSHDHVTITGQLQKLSFGEKHISDNKNGLRDFRRMIMLPSDVEASKVEAYCEDEVLRICAPKTANSKPREIGVAESSKRKLGNNQTLLINLRPELSNLNLPKSGKLMRPLQSYNKRVISNKSLINSVA